MWQAGILNQYLEDKCNTNGRKLPAEKRFPPSDRLYDMVCVLQLKRRYGDAKTRWRSISGC